MIFQRKYERALNRAREIRGESPSALTDASLGDQLEKGVATSSRRVGSMRIGVDTLPPLPLATPIYSFS